MRKALIFAAIFFVALAAPLAFNNQVPRYDEASYHNAAQGVLKTGFPKRSIGSSFGELYAFHPPMAHYVTALFILPGQDSLTYARASSLVAILVSLWFMTNLIQLLGISSYAPFVLFLFATQSLTVYFGALNYTEPILLLFCLASLYAFLTGRNTVSALWMGAAILTKYTAVLYMAPILLLLFLHRRNFITTAQYALIALAPLLAWVGALYMVDAQTTVAQLSDVVNQVGGQKNFASWAIPLPFYTKTSVLPGLGLLALMPFLALAMFRRQRWTKLPTLHQHALKVFLAIVFAHYIAIALVGYKQLRYLLPVVPILVLITLIWLSNRRSDQLKSTLTVWRVGLLVLLFASSTPLLDLALSTSKKQLGKPKNFLGFYNEQLTYDASYRPFTTIISKTKKASRKFGKKPFALLARPDLANRMVPFMNAYSCTKKCKRPDLILVNRRDKEDKALLRQFKRWPRGYKRIERFTKTGFRLKGPLELWQRR